MTVSVAMPDKARLAKCRNVVYSWGGVATTVRPGEYVSSGKLRLLGGTKEDGRWCFDLEASDGRRESLCAAPVPDDDGAYLAPGASP